MFQPLLGVVAIFGLAWLSSSDRRAFPWRLAFSGLALQFALALMLLKIPLLHSALLIINQLVLEIEAATRAGTTMVFGYLGGGPEPFTVTSPQHSFILAFRALPLVIVFSVLSAILWHWRVVPKVVGALAWLLQRSMPVSGAVGLGSAASIFVGMVEAPILIRPYLAKLTNSELFVLMSCGMATVAGTVLGLYAAILSPVLPDALSQLIVASVISAPAAIVVALIIRPGKQSAQVPVLDMRSPYTSTLAAVTQGTQDGLKLFLNIAVSLIVFVALVSLVNGLLGYMPTSQPLSLQAMLGWCLQPLMWAIGIPWSEVGVAGELMATKVILNELVAYLNLAALPEGSLSERSELIMTYAMCGFANFGSLGILLGGLNALCPERSQDIMRLAPLTIWSGTLATSLTGAVVALIY